jgi:hypothetical protein
LSFGGNGAPISQYFISFINIIIMLTTKTLSDKVSTTPEMLDISKGSLEMQRKQNGDSYSCGEQKHIDASSPPVQYLFLIFQFAIFTNFLSHSKTQFINHYHEVSLSTLAQKEVSSGVGMSLRTSAKRCASWNKFKFQNWQANNC